MSLAVPPGSDLRFALRKQWPLALFVVCVIATAIIAGIVPRRTITAVYWGSAQDWWNSIPVYGPGIHGFLYFPSSAFLYGPFALLPLEWADHIWRFVTTLLLGFATYRAVSVLERGSTPQHRLRLAGGVLLLSFPALSINLLRGQWELVMFAVMLLAVCELAERRFERAGWFLAFAVALKPLALVLVLTVMAVRPRVVPTLALGLLLTLILPFLHPDPSYVAHQYVAMASKLMAAAKPESGSWFDLTVFLRAMGYHPAYDSMTLARMAAAIATVGLCSAVLHRFEVRQGSFLVLAVVCIYLVLMNPRTEEGSYGGLALLLGLVAVSKAAQVQTWRVALGALALALGTHAYGDWIYRPTETWLKQLVALATLAIIALLTAKAEPLPAVISARRPAPGGGLPLPRVTPGLQPNSSSRLTRA